MPLRLAAVVFVAALGADVVGHLLSQPALEEAAHLAILLAMVAVLVAIVTGPGAQPGRHQQGDRHAVR